MTMRNIDYRKLYQMVLEGEQQTKVENRRGTYDGMTSKERTTKEVKDNKARDISVKLAKKGMGTGKRGVAPVAPLNLPTPTQEDFHQKCQALIDEGFCKDESDLARLFELLG